MPFGGAGKEFGVLGVQRAALAFGGAEQNLPRHGIGASTGVLLGHVPGKPELEQAAMAYGVGRTFPEEDAFRLEFGKAGRRGEGQPFPRGIGLGLELYGFCILGGGGRSRSEGGAEQGGGKQKGRSQRPGWGVVSAGNAVFALRGEGQGRHGTKMGRCEILSRPGKKFFVQKSITPCQPQPGSSKPFQPESGEGIRSRTAQP